MTNARLARSAYRANVWAKRGECPTCGAKTGERCFAQRSVYPKPCSTPHDDRPILPQYRRVKPTQ